MLITSLICREGLGEGYDGDIAFASALETFGGGHNDPIGVAFGGSYFYNFVQLFYCNFDVGRIEL